jgi:Putative lipoprotein LpqV
MRSYPVRAINLRWLTAVTLAAAGFGVLTGCTTGSDGGQPPSPTATTTTSEIHTPARGAVEVSPGGVTTAVGAAAESTEEEYFQACLAAKVWMEQHGGDPKTQIEPYLASLQTSDAAAPATFGTPWSQLAPARQAAVIVAVQAAADALCG